MVINYKKRKLVITLPSEIDEEIRQTAHGMNWTDEEIFLWSLEFGISEIGNAGEIEKRISELLNKKSELDKQVEDPTKDYVKLSTRNAALRYECYEAFSNNKTGSIKLTGAKAKNRSFKQVLNIVRDSKERESRTDNEIIEKYVLTCPER
jgi:hypothetical protein